MTGGFLRRLAAAGGLLLLAACFALLFLPADVLLDAAGRGLSREGFSLRAAKVRKALPLGLSVRGAEFSDSRGVLLKLDEAKVALRLLPLLRGELAVSFSGRIGAGTLEGTAGRQGASFEARDIPLQEVPFFATATGAAVRGTFSCQGLFSGAGDQLAGEIKAEVSGAEVAAVRIGGMQLPDAAFTKVQGVLRVKNRKATLDSLTFQGDGLYARLSGEAPLLRPLGGSLLSLSLELMPKPEFLEKQKLVFLLLVKYLESPGHYRIPIRGSLAQPAII